MSRNYRKISDDIINNGFFSEYLPPCFNLDKKALSKIPSKNCDLIPPISFTMSRYNVSDARRTIYIPEIAAYNTVCNYLKVKNILEELIEFANESYVSFSPILALDDSIIRHERSYDVEITDDEVNLSDYVENLSKKIIRARGAKYVLRLDISNFFSSFYMHMIPAILLGYEEADKEYRKSILDKNDTTISDTYKKYQDLDAIVRKQNQNRTNGLLTGPLLSKIIAEALLTRIDMELIEKGLNFTRYMDDYEVYIYDEHEKKIIDIVVSVLAKYGFALNHEKTTKELFPYYILNDLEKHIKYFNLKEINTLEVMELFNTFLNFEKNGTKGAVRYLLKYIEKHPLEIGNKALYKSYLLNILSNNERSLSKVCSLLINEYKDLNEEFDERDVEIVTDLLEESINTNNDLEVMWLLYLLIRLKKLKNSNEILDKIVQSKNELAILILLSAELLNESHVEKVKESAKSWILLYELFERCIISEDDLVRRLGLNKSKSVYTKLKKAKVRFCNI